MVIGVNNKRMRLICHFMVASLVATCHRNVLNTVSQKNDTALLWLAITLMYITQILYILAGMLRTEQAVKL